VRLLNGSAGYSPGYTLSTSVLPSGVASGSERANILVEDSELGTIADSGGSWLFRNSHLITTAADGPEYAYTYLREDVQSDSNVTFIGCRIEVRVTTYDVASTAAIWTAGDAPGAINIIGSEVIVANLASGPSGVNAAIYEDDETSNMTLTVEGSLIRYESVMSAGGGEFYGIYAEEDTSGPIHVRGSSFQSAGTGGTRADVNRDATGAPVTLAATQYSSVVGAGAMATADLRQGQFSIDLIVPLTSPTLGPVNGQVWIDTGTNKLCYRSGSTTRCLTGS